MWSFSNFFSYLYTQLAFYFINIFSRILRKCHRFKIHFECPQAGLTFRFIIFFWYFFYYIHNKKKHLNIFYSTLDTTELVNHIFFQYIVCNLISESGFFFIAWVSETNIICILLLKACYVFININNFLNKQLNTLIHFPINKHVSYILFFQTSNFRHMFMIINRILKKRVEGNIKIKDVL